MERLLPSHEVASKRCFHLPPCSQLAGHYCWWQSYMQMQQWWETSLWAPDTMKVACHYILKLFPPKTHPLLGENKKEPDRQRPGQWIYWTLKLPFFFFVDKFILFSLCLDPPGVWFIQRNVFPFGAVECWHDIGIGIIFASVTQSVLTPRASSSVPCRETTEWGVMCFWYVLLEFRMNFLSSWWLGAIKILLKVF